jgi:hypothetical protein
MSINKNFVIKHGLEVKDTLIYANPDNNRVGIKTALPQHTFDVIGGIGASTLTVRQGVTLQGSLSVGSTTGKSGEYLVSTGQGVEWADLPAARQTITVPSANTGQTIFDIGSPYISGYIDVFINGVKLSASEYIEDAPNGTITLTESCFGGEVVEFNVYASYILGVADVLDSANYIGIVTASSFRGGIGSFSNVYTTGIVTATNGFTSGIGITNPVKITVVDNQLIFNVVGVGSTSLTLFAE